MKILIIDDDPGAVKLFCIIMKKEGHTSLGAHSGPEGLAIAGDFQPDVIVLDVMMPEMDGWEVLWHLRNDEDCAEIPVIIWSAMTGYGNEELAETLGAQAYVRKGCGVSAILKAIEALRADPDE